jgi:acyl-coenzyme A synthetase/AMP-(fatty) acid ligase
MLDPRFTLIEGGRTLALGDIPTCGGTVDVAGAGAAGVIGALKGGDGWIARDRSVPAGDGPGIHLQTSGTTGAPKWAAHTVDGLAATIQAGKDPARWLLTYNPGSFAGVQVILSAVLSGHTLVAPPYGASVAEMADLAVAHQVTHISGTPTFWRAFLMALGERPLELKAVTLGGEAVDQTLLDALKARFPGAILRHIYATTELGRIFSVGDGRAGFPAELLKGRLGLSERGTLTVGGVDTGDVVEVVDDRVLFRGRADSMVNVGGVKVYPETVEAHILASPWVQEARVTSKPNPITGSILVADIVLKPLPGDHEQEIRAHMTALPRAQRPASLRFVEAIETGATGKKART